MTICDRIFIETARVRRKRVDSSRLTCSQPGCGHASRGTRCQRWQTLTPPLPKLDGLILEPFRRTTAASWGPVHAATAVKSGANLADDPTRGRMARLLAMGSVFVPFELPVVEAWGEA